MNFERVLQKVLWRLVTEGSISYRRTKLSFQRMAVIFVFSSPSGSARPSPLEEVSNC